MALFLRRPEVSQIVEAEQLTAGAQVHPQGGRPGRPGDWLVKDHLTGREFIMTDTEFSQQYVSAPIPGNSVPFNPPSAFVEPGLMQADASDVNDPGQFGKTAQDMQPQPPQAPGLGDQAPTTQVLSEPPGGPARPSTAPERRPMQAQAEPVTSPTGLPAQPGDADKEFRDQEKPPITPLDGGGNASGSDPDRFAALLNENRVEEPLTGDNDGDPDEDPDEDETLPEDKPAS